MRWLTVRLTLPPDGFFLHYWIASPIHLHIQDRNWLAQHDWQIQLYGAPDFCLLTLRNIRTNRFCRPLHGFSGHLQAGE